MNFQDKNKYKPLVAKLTYNELIEACKKNDWELLTKEEMLEAYEMFKNQYDEKATFWFENQQCYSPFFSKLNDSFETIHECNSVFKNNVIVKRANHNLKNYDELMNNAKEKNFIKMKDIYTNIDLTLVDQFIEECLKNGIAIRVIKGLTIDIVTKKSREIYDMNTGSKIKIPAKYSLKLNKSNKWRNWTLED
jgi:nucleoid DNA-binding protein